ncbi:hypothetical protein BDY21DRAFT_104817 [Lineolata rhizophorae]|uniref:Cupredoxin n=1 Tax=Lineolata rhizophorae TaxID=578093 RepID=A0A6A6NRP8_9PEZI|nr:hypothetical protein BDY21DRAFT_104817 [Lineolata rhizophorae]
MPTLSGSPAMGRSPWRRSFVRLAAVAFLTTSLFPSRIVAQGPAYESAYDADATPTSSEASQTSSAASVTHTVEVGRGDHKFRPDVIQAEAGDVIEFRFYPTKHSVVRAEYGDPCIPYEMTGRGKVGFFSGFFQQDTILDDPPTWHLPINDTDPAFFYCSAPGSCTDWGMVGVINPNATVSLERQREWAEESSYQLNPGEPFPAEGSGSPSSDADSYGSEDDDSDDDHDDHAHHGLSAGAIAGISIGAAAVVIIAGGLFFWMGRRPVAKEQARRSATVAPHPDPYASTGFAPVKQHPPADYRRSEMSGVSYAEVPPYSEGYDEGRMSPAQGGLASPGSPPYNPDYANPYATQ